MDIALLAPTNGCSSSEPVALQLGIACDSLCCGTLVMLQKLHATPSTTPVSLIDVCENSKGFVDVNLCNGGVKIERQNHGEDVEILLVIAVPGLGTPTRKG